jgi:hypothetical protein
MGFLKAPGNGKWILKPMMGNGKCVCSTGFREMGLIRKSAPFPFYFMFH